MLSIKCSKTVRICLFLIAGTAVCFMLQYVAFQRKVNDNVQTMTKVVPPNLEPVVKKSPFIPPPGLLADKESTQNKEGGPQTDKIQPTLNLTQRGPLAIPQITNAIKQMDPMRLALLKQWAQGYLNGQGANVLPQMNPQDPLINLGPNVQGPNNNMPVPMQYPFPQTGVNNNAIPQLPNPNLNLPQLQNPVNFPQYQGQDNTGNIQYQNFPQGPFINNMNGYQMNLVPEVSPIQEKLPPEVEGGPDTNILRWNGNGWTKLDHFCGGKLKLNRTLLKSPAGTAVVYIHDLKDDKYVSGSLKTNGLWDKVDVTVMINNLDADPELGFIDIGSHVGTFSLVAALMGRQVVAVDPLVVNVIRFCKSVQANNFTDKITIFYTAISDTYKKVSFQRDIGNIGGTRIVTAPANTNTSNIYDPNFIDTVRLDDLVPHIPFRKAFIKMDVEEHEYEVISSGPKFFKEIDVRGILMEWMWQRTGKNGFKLRNLLLGMNFSAFTPDGTVGLDPSGYRNWPTDVLWKKMV